MSFFGVQNNLAFSRDKLFTSRLVLINLGILLSALGGVFVGYSGRVGLYALPLVAAGLMLALMCLTIVHRLRRGNFDWFETINFFYLGMGVGFVIRGVYIAIGLYNRETAFETADDFIFFLTLAMWYGLLGILAFLLGYYQLVGARRVASHLPVFKPEIKTKLLYSIIFFYTIIGLVGLVILLKQSGFSLASLSLAEIARKRHYLDTTHYVTSVPDLLFSALVLLSMVHFTKRRTPFFWILIVLASIWPVYSSSRSTFATVCLTVLIIYSYLVRRISTRTILIVAITAMFALSVLLGLRGLKYQGTEHFETALTAEGTLDNILGSTKFADVVTFAHVLQAIPYSLQLQYGATYLDLLTRPIPRDWWPEKPQNLGQYVSDVLWGHEGENAGGIPIPMIAEFYWNFHLPGIMAGMFLAGFLSRILYMYFDLNRRNVYTVTLYATIVIFVFRFTSTNFVNIATEFLLMMFPLLIAMYLSSGGFIQKPTSK